jgi:DnaJ-class molecular chaperone
MCEPREKQAAARRLTRRTNTNRVNVMGPDATQTITCPACNGDGWGIETDGLVTVMTEHGCRGCTGTGVITDAERPNANRVAAIYQKLGG